MTKSRKKTTGKTVAISRNVRIEDIARAVGMSSATVSRAFSDPAKVKPVTREKIYRVAKQHNWTPNPVARQLVRSEQKIVGLWEPAVYPTRYSSTLLRALDSGLRGRDMIPVHILSDLERHIASVAQIVLVDVERDTQTQDLLERSGVPYVCIGRSRKGLWLSVDDIHGGELIGHHLVERGYGHVLVISDTNVALAFEERLLGLQNVLQATPSIRVEVHREDFNAGFAVSGYRAMSKLVRSAGSALPDVLVAMTDEVAQGAIMAFEDAGLRVPEDIAVVGYDGLPNLRYRLTTVAQDFEAIAAGAISLLNDLGEIEVGYRAPVTFSPGDTS